MYSLRKLLLSFAFAACFAGNAMAVPAYPGIMPHRQADGTIVNVYMRGDEFGHMFLSEDGFPLVENGKGSLEYAQMLNGKLVPSGIIAENAAMRSSRAKAFLAQADKARLVKVATDAMSASIQKGRNLEYQLQHAPRKVIGDTRIRISDVPTTGKHKGLIILVNFSDRKFSMDDPMAYYDKFFHEKGFSENGATGSVYDFYHDGSGGNYDPDFVVVGPVTVSNTAAYYGGGDHSSDAWQMVREACIAADSLVDFKDFDTDGDGECDNVYIFYAGFGYADTNGNMGDCIWPHSFYLDVNNKDNSVTLDGVKVNRYTVSQELDGRTAVSGKGNIPAGIGTFCHEFGHVLGMPDLYATNGSNTGPDNWSVMSVGCYNNNMHTPPTFSSYERYELGWIDPVELKPGGDSINNLSNLFSSNFAYKVSVPGKSNEYFLLENRQQTDWDTYLPYHGMLVWHIQEDQQKWTYNTVNNDINHQNVDIYEAAGSLTYAPYPGESNTTAKTFNDWDGNKVFGLLWIGENDGVISMLRDDSSYRLNAPKLTVGNIRGITAEASWTKSGLRLPGSDTDEDVDGYDFFVTNDDGSVVARKQDTKGLSYSITGLEPQTQYTANVVAKYQGLRSDTVKAQFTTIDRQLEETKVLAHEATAVSDHTFTANWEPVKGANAYTVSLYTRENAGREEYGTGFDNFKGNNSDLPEGWTANYLADPNTRYYGDYSPSYSLNADGAYLEISKPGQKLVNIRFWHRSNNAGNKLVVEQQVSGKWQQVGSALQTARNAKSITTLNLDNADKVRITLQRSDGEVLLDDVYATYSYETYTPVTTVDVNADEVGADSLYSYTFLNLEAGKLYSYTVQAKADGDRQSLASDMIIVPGSDVPSGINNVATGAHAASAVIYNVQGQKVGSTDGNGTITTSLPAGVYIVNGKKIVIKLSR